ncbi:MAG: serine/threonine protein kinase, partial [Myxococcales bacterium]|nr:serine/threonine protein kinase [Myxococcales bacterium]
MQNVSAGQVFAGDYQIVRPLGRGGMGTVFLALQLSTGRQRALKMLQPHLVEDPRMRERFALEARAASNLQSDHVVEVVAAGIDAATGTPWLAMEYLEGETLDDRVHRLGRLGPAEVAEIARQLCHGLSLAHQAGLVHRDLKPANVFVANPRREGVPFTVKLLDFGIAKLTQVAHASTSAPIGSPGWMAPEQFDQRPATAATDIWAFGLVMFHCLVGSSYWLSKGQVHALLHEIMTSHLPPASERAQQHGVAVPNGFDAWFARCIARTPEQRFASIDAALDALLGVLSQAPASLVTLGTLPGSVPAGPAAQPPTYPTVATQPPTYPSSLPPSKVPTRLEAWPQTGANSTLSPLADRTSRPPTKSGAGKWMLAGSALFGGLALAGLAAAVIAGGLWYYHPWDSAPVASTAPTVSAAPTAPAAASAEEVPTEAAPSTGKKAPSVAVVTPTKTPSSPTPSTTPSASAAPSASASAAPPAEGPTPTAVAGFRALVLNCWRDNEGATAEQGGSISVTVGINGTGAVTQVIISNAAPYPHLRSCVVSRATMYPGFKPATFSQTTIGVSLPAAKKKDGG